MGKENILYEEGIKVVMARQPRIEYNKEYFTMSLQREI